MLTTSETDLVAIDLGVPMPPILRNGHAAKYPWREMEVGDSFFMPNVYNSQAPLANKRLAPKRFSRRRVVENGVKGQRIWRVE